MQDRRPAHCLAILFTLLFATGVAYSQTSVFTYQGKLTDTSIAADGHFDFVFRLYDSPAAQNQIGSDVSVNGVTVTAGIFTVNLDFGSAAFVGGAPRYLLIFVRPSGNGGFTPLVPLQPITSAPFAIKSQSSDDSAQLGGVAAAQYVITTDPRLNDARSPAAGSSNYVQNSSSQQTATNFNISGSGTVGGAISGNVVNATTQYSIGGTRILSSTGSTVTVGQFAGQSNTGSFNSFFGNSAGNANTSGTSNSFFGSGAGIFNSTAGNNSFFGANAGNNNNSGGDNSFFGKDAGATNSSGSQITLVGSGANVGVDGLSNATAIGSHATVSQNNSLVLGNNANVGIGTTAPNTRLHVIGNVRIASGGLLITSPGQGVLLAAPNGNCYALTVSNAGALSTSLVSPCP